MRVGKTTNILRLGLGVFSLGQGEAVFLRRRFAGVASWSMSPLSARFMAHNIPTLTATYYTRQSHDHSLLLQLRLDLPLLYRSRPLAQNPSQQFSTGRNRYYIDKLNPPSKMFVCHLVLGNVLRNNSASSLSMSSELTYLHNGSLDTICFSGVFFNPLGRVYS